MSEEEAREQRKTVAAERAKEREEGKQKDRRRAALEGLLNQALSRRAQREEQGERINRTRPARVWPSEQSGKRKRGTRGGSRRRAMVSSEGRIRLAERAANPQADRRDTRDERWRRW